MSDFRIKNTKYTAYKNNNKFKSTVDIKHKQKINEIEKNDTLLNKFNQKLIKYNKELNNLLINNDFSIKMSELISNMKNNIEDLNYQIDLINSDNNEIVTINH